MPRPDPPRSPRFRLLCLALGAVQQAGRILLDQIRHLLDTGQITGDLFWTTTA